MLVFSNAGLIESAAGFISPAVMHADLGTTLGTVPAAYNGFQMIRSIALHINLTGGKSDQQSAEEFSFDVSASTTLVYAHPTLNDHDLFRPSWLTGANGWSNTGRTGTISLPDGLTASAFQDVTVDYYEKTGVTGTFSYAGFRSSDFLEKLGHYVGVFLIPSGITVSAIVPQHYELIPDISASYTAPDRDALMWDDTPPTFNEASFDAQSFTAWVTAANAASPGDVVVIEDNVSDYTVGGIQTVTASGTAAQPIIMRCQTPGGAGFSGAIELRITGDFVIVEGVKFSGAFTAGSRVIRLEAGSEWNVVRNCFFEDVTGGVFLIQDQGAYNTLHNNDVDNHNEDVQDFLWQPASRYATTCVYGRMHHNDIINKNSSGGASEVMQLGNFLQQDTLIGGICDHNRIDASNPTTETEGIGVKCRGIIVANNLQNNSDFDISFRASADYLTFANRFFNTTSSFNRNRAGQIQGTEIFGPETIAADARSDGLHALDWTDKHVDPNGSLNLIRVGTDATSRFPANQTLVVGVMVVTGTNDIYRNGTDGSTGLVFPKNIHFQGCAGITTSTAFDVSEWAIQSDHTFTACVIFGVGDSGDSPTGNTYEDPVFVDRGDGIDIPTHADLDFGVNVCFPGRLEGGAIPNVGRTWT